MQETISMIIQTLNLVEVKGKANLDMLLGCILELEKLSTLVTEEDETNGR